jgi:hypothetical protein
MTSLIMGAALAACIVGAGVVGCALYYWLTQWNKRRKFRQLRRQREAAFRQWRSINKLFGREW